MNKLNHKTVFITGASRGIGKAIGLRLAQEGANVVVASKTAEPHPSLPGTIYTAAADIESAGGKALPLVMDLRFEDQVEAAVRQAADHFGGIDILVNNASAISLTSTELTPVKRYDLMHQVNVRGTFIASQKCIPYLKRAENPHILNISPPLNFEAKWFAPHLAYSMTKYGMSLCVLGMSAEFRDDGIAVNALWPKTTIATAAIKNLLGGAAVMRRSRKPEILGDCAFFIFSKDSRSCTGNFFVDEDLLKAEGITDLTSYAVDPDSDLAPDFFV